MYLLQLGSHSDMRRRFIKCCFCALKHLNPRDRCFFVVPMLDSAIYGAWIIVCKSG